MNRGCEFFADALVERATGGLDPERAGRVDAHLAQCAECAASFRTIQALKGAPLAVPEGLEARLATAAVAAAAAERGRDMRGDAHAPGRDAKEARPRPRPRHVSWRPWALPLAAAAAAAAVWLGVGAPGIGNGNGHGADLVAFDEYDPWGAWPADGLLVAGQPMLSELSVEELEDLLRELES
jgi:anti-sigma factor RsiW